VHHETPEREPDEVPSDEEQESGSNAEAAGEASDEAKQKMAELEEDPPEKLEDWPKDEAMYQTFGGPEGDHAYDEGPERKLGPASLRHHEGGEVSIEGEKVDDPEEYKGEPIPGGPTDPSSPDARGEDDD
jgi:hypothetical protein